jgi:GGDEF domain-containing protein
VLIVGGGDAGQFAAWMLANGRRARIFHVIGYVDDDLYKYNALIRGVKVLGRCEGIERLVEKHDIGIIVFAIHNIPHQERQKILADCERTMAKVVMLPDFLGSMSAVAAHVNQRKTRPKPGGFPDGADLSGPAIIKSIPSQPADWSLLDRKAIGGEGGIQNLLLGIQGQVATTLHPSEVFIDRLCHGVVQAKRQQTRLAVILIIVDDFEPRFLPDDGDHLKALLESTGRCISSNLREGDTIAQIGVCELAILIETCSNYEGIEIVGQKILACLNQPISVNGEEISVKAIVGTSVYPDDGINATDLLFNAYTNTGSDLQIRELAHVGN